MKRSEVRPGVVAMLSLGGRKGAVRVTVVRGAFTSDPRKQAWVCEDSSGRYRTATPRQLQPMPVCRPHGALRIVSSQTGQTIDAGDVVIETTLHRLG
jgi:hypothetical protein